MRLPFFRRPAKCAATKTNSASEPIKKEIGTFKSEAEQVPPELLCSLTTETGAQEPKPVNRKKIEKQSDLMRFLDSECPADVTRLILALSGPQAVAALSKVNKAWNRLVNEEGTWRVLCEELKKWDDSCEAPSSWKEYYRTNPIVPVDFSSIRNALKTVCNEEGGEMRRRNQKLQHLSVRILLKPGRYEMRGQIHIQAARPNVEVCIERIGLPAAAMLPSSEVVLYSSADPLYHQNDDPIFRVSSGKLVLRDLTIVHYSPGERDLWEGNCAVLVQDVPHEGIPAQIPGQDLYSRDWLPGFSSGASVIMERCEITSCSGGGLVILSAGEASVHDSHIHRCSSTGLLATGERVSIHVQNSDIRKNCTFGLDGTKGYRGQAGLYLEKCKARIKNSSISENYGCGMAVKSFVDLKRLDISGSEILCNAGVTVNVLDLPERRLQPEAESLSTCIPALRNNKVAPKGKPRARSYTDTPCFEDGTYPKLSSVDWFENFYLF